MRGRLIYESKLVDDLRAEFDTQSKKLAQAKSDNAYMLRNQEKNKMFTDRREEKALTEQDAKNNEMIDHLKLKVIEGGIELEKRKKQFDDMTLIKEYDNENIELIVSFPAIVP